MSLIDKLDTKVTRERVWLGFPHYVVLGWALLLSWQVYQLRERAAGLERVSALEAQQNDEIHERILELIDKVSERQQDMMNWQAKITERLESINTDLQEEKADHRAEHRK